MRNGICLIVIVVLFSLCGCNNGKNFFSDNVKVVDDQFKISSFIRGEKLPIDDIYSISSLICFDEYLLVLTPRADNVFNVLTFNGEIISRFGTIGRANDELVNCQFNGQAGKVAGDNCVWLSDVGKGRMVLIDIDKSMKEGKIVIIKEMKTSPMVVFCFYVNDSVFITEQLTGNNYELQKRNILLNKIFQETLYRDDDARAFSLYKSTWRLDSHGNKMVGAMRSVNQINFYSIADQKRWSIVIGEQRTDKNELINDETGLERMSTFADLEMTDTGICALYINQDYDDAYEKAKPQDLLFFDMDGNLDRVVRLNEYVIDIAVSSDGEYLYGRTPSDEIYRYRLVTE